MIKGIIFDADGTLLDSMKFWDSTVYYQLSLFGISQTDELIEILTPMSMREGAEYLKNRYNLSVSIEKIIQEENKMVEEFYTNSVQLRKGTLDLLNFLSEKNIPMAVATATDSDLIEKALEHTGILSFFKSIISCSDVGEGKTSPKVFFNACEVMGTSVNETLVVEDSLTALLTAKKFGFKTGAVFDETQKKNWEQMKKTADLCIENNFDINLFSDLL